MTTDGKQLESLVAFVEEKLLPRGFDVKLNERVFNDEGRQVAEFDIEIRGKVGTTTIAWLIECRDRPGHGPAPGAWIEQLVGRRTRFGFNKVTAVSTTGFASGATTFAHDQGIELREVRSLDPSEFADWLQIRAMQQVNRISDLKHANIFIHAEENDQAKEAAKKVISGADGNTRILISSNSFERANLSEAFLGAVQAINGAFDGVESDRPLRVEFTSQYRDDDHYLIETSTGRVRVSQIEFLGELRVELIEVPIIKTAEYRHAETGDVISQHAVFAPQSIAGMKLALEMHRIADTGETHIGMRRLPNDP